MTAEPAPITIEPGSLNLTDTDREWVARKWWEIRRAQMLADAANNDWKALNAEVESYLDRSGVADIVQRARIKGENLALADALGVGKWQAENAQRHIDDVALFLRLKELGLL